MRMQPAQFRIGELAKSVGVERFVIRFWEKEFNLKSDRSTGGQRFYTNKDLETFKKIKSLLYEKKYTIEGARKILQDKNTSNIIGTYKTSLDYNPSDKLYKKLQELKKNLLKLKETL